MPIVSSLASRAEHKAHILPRTPKCDQCKVSMQENSGAKWPGSLDGNFLHIQ